MKKLIMMMAMAVGLTVFAGQDDKTITVVSSGDTYADGTAVVDGESYALVWVKNGCAFAGFNSDGTLVNAEDNALVQQIACAQNGGCNCTFQIAPDDFEAFVQAGALSVFLLDTRARADETAALYAYGECVSGITGEGSVRVSGTVASTLLSDTPAAEVSDGVTFEVAEPLTYADGKTVLLDGERFVLVKFPKDRAFQGIDWNFKAIGADDEVLGVFATAAQGKCAAQEVEIANPDANASYEIVVVDSRLNGAVSAGGTGNAPKFVSAWGVCVPNGEGKVASVRWNVVRLGLSASYPVSEFTFDFDPTPYLAKGYAAISPDDGQWQVYRLPQAWVEPCESPVLKKGDNYQHLRAATDVPASFTLESAYKFSAFSTDPKVQAVALKFLQNDKDLGALTEEERAVVYEWANQVQPFWGWNADFEVSFDREVEADSVILAGWYDYTSAWSGKYSFDWTGTPWVGSSPSEKFVPGVTEPIRLLKSYIGRAGAVTMNYEEICTKVIQFLCGVKNLSPENYGTTMTVKLCIYENTGRCHESGRRVVIGTYNYTFCGPLDITFKEGYDWPDDAVLPQPNPLHTNHNGRLSFVLPAPTYTESHEELAFVGWSNDVDKTIMTYIPTNTWKAYELYGTWKPAKTVVINPDTNKTENVASIKVADDWLEENNLKDATAEQVAETLQKPAEDGGKIPLWQTYVLGLNPSGSVSVVATEKLSDDKALVVSTVEAPAPDSGFKVTYSLDKIDKTSEEPIDDEHKGKEQETKDISIDLEPQGGETPTGYYKMNVFITPVKDDVVVKDEKVQVKSEVTVGVLTVKTEEPVVPVAIPWTSLAETPDENAEIPADEIVQPQGLTDGDQLFVYDRQGEVYTTLTLTGGKWVADGQTVPVDETGTPEEPTQAGVVPTVKRGYGMWLKRQDTSKNFHLFGQYNKTAEKTKIVPPALGQDKAEYNLIAPTGIEDTDLNSIPSLGTGVDPQDKLMIVEKGVPTYYNFNSDTKKWGYNKQEIVTRTVGGRTVTGVQTKRVEEAVNVSAGTGLWYISKGGEPEIDWNAKKGE